jgi:hypothetical protein
MVGLMQDSVDDGCELVSLRLQGASAAAFDLAGAVGDVAKEPADVVLDLRLGPEAGVGGDLLADPAPDGLVGVEVRAVGRQAEARVGRTPGRTPPDAPGPPSAAASWGT